MKKIFKICLSFIVLVSVMVFSLSMILGTPLVSVFAEEGTVVHGIARKGFTLFPIGFLFCGVNIFASAFFTALSNGKVSAVISSLRTFVFLILFLLILPLFIQETGVWMAVPLTEFFTLVFSVVFLYTEISS